MGYSKQELAAFEGKTVDDLLGPGIRLLFVGINPGLWTAATNTHFCHPSNRFYPALRAAGLIDWAIDTDVGMTTDQKRSLVQSGIGITNLVPRATVRASELSASELMDGADRVSAIVDQVEPVVVAIAGVTAYRTAFGRPAAGPGRQPEALGGSELWVVPNPSGLNAHETVESLASWYLEVATAAGLL